MRNLKAMMIASALIALPSLAMAQPGGEGSHTRCNGRGNPNSRCAGDPGGGGSGGGASPSVITNRNSARAAATGIGIGIARGGAGGSARATGGAGGAASATGTGTGGNATVNVSGVGAGGGGGGSYSYTERLRVPDVQAPAIWSNNPCVVALSGGVAVAGFGASIGAGIEDRDCTRRANAQHLQAMGETGAAREVLCENAEVRAAFQRVGRPCASDQPRVVSTSARLAAVPLPPATQAAASRTVPGWCSSYTAAERARMSVCR